MNEKLKKNNEQTSVKQDNGEHSLAFILMQEMRAQNKRQSKYLFVFVALCLILIGYIMYDRWLDSQVESECVVQSDNYINQDNMTNSNGGGHYIINSNK